MTVRATHVLVPSDLVEALRLLSRQTRVSQAEYLREAVADLLAKHRGRTVPLQWPTPDANDGDLRSVVFRAEEDVLSRVGELAAVTRVRPSEYLREAIWDVVAKYAHALHLPRSITRYLPAGRGPHVAAEAVQLDFGGAF